MVTSAGRADTYIAYTSQNTSFVGSLCNRLVVGIGDKVRQVDKRVKPEQLEMRGPQTIEKNSS